MGDRRHVEIFSAIFQRYIVQLMWSLEGRSITKIANFENLDGWQPTFWKRLYSDFALARITILRTVTWRIGKIFKIRDGLHTHAGLEIVFRLHLSAISFGGQKHNQNCVTHVFREGRQCRNMALFIDINCRVGERKPLHSVVYVIWPVPIFETFCRMAAIFRKIFWKINKLHLNFCRDSLWHVAKLTILNFWPLQNLTLSQGHSKYTRLVLGIYPTLPYSFSVILLTDREKIQVRT